VPVSLTKTARHISVGPARARHILPFCDTAALPSKKRQFPPRRRDLSPSILLIFL
jgi:hypothetical protein